MWAAFSFENTQRHETGDRSRWRNIQESASLLPGYTLLVDGACYPAHVAASLPASRKVDLAELQGQMADEWLREREANRKLLGTVFMVREPPLIPPPQKWACGNQGPMHPACL